MVCVCSILPGVGNTDLRRVEFPSECAVVRTAVSQQGRGLRSWCPVEALGGTRGGMQEPSFCSRRKGGTGQLTSLVSPFVLGAVKSMYAHTMEFHCVKHFVGCSRFCLSKILRNILENV